MEHVMRRMPLYYTLDEQDQPVPGGDPLEWARWMEEHRDRKHIGYNELPNGYRVSTVFLGLDHSFGQPGDPVLWESMVFPPHDSGERECERYTNAKDALAGHRKMVKRWRRKKGVTHE